MCNVHLSVPRAISKYRMYMAELLTVYINRYDLLWEKRNQNHMPSYSIAIFSLFNWCTTLTVAVIALMAHIEKISIQCSVKKCYNYRINWHTHQIEVTRYCSTLNFEIFNCTSIIATSTDHEKIEKTALWNFFNFLSVSRFCIRIQLSA